MLHFHVSLTSCVFQLSEVIVSIPDPLVISFYNNLIQRTTSNVNKRIFNRICLGHLQCQILFSIHVLKTIFRLEATASVVSEIATPSIRTWIGLVNLGRVRWSDDVRKET